MYLKGKNKKRENRRKQHGKMIAFCDNSEKNRLIIRYWTAVKKTDIAAMGNIGLVKFVYSEDAFSRYNALYIV